MNEFEKWWKEFEPQINPDDCGGCGNDTMENVAKDAWKRALEWVLTHRKYRQPLNGPYFSWYAKIQKELEDE